MNLTTFLAQLWGPTLLAIGIGIFVSQKYYLKTYRDLQKETFVLLVFSMLTIPAGLAHIRFHHTWNTFPEIVISLLGWGLLLKGIVFAIVPGFVDKAGDFEAKTKLVPLAGALTIILGIYLSWIGWR